MLRQLQDDIVRLKKERDVCILAHSYQAREILEVADYTGDSYQLSVSAANTSASTVLMCGVRFMAETVKILSPEKRVILANETAGCPMAEQMDKDLVEGVQTQFPDYATVAYINTTAELKTICDVCVTSSSAVRIVSRIENDNILFLPDRNLGAYVAAQLPQKHFKLFPGCCPIHAAVDEAETLKAKAAHPSALLLVHPECAPEVVRHADFVGSTSAIMEYAKASDAREFLIGTEMSIAEHLQYDCPDKRFYPLSHKLLCPNMKVTTLPDVRNALLGTGGEEIVLAPAVIAQARRCIDTMIQLGG